MKRVIHEFTLAAAKFHYRQDQVNLKDSMQVRKFNDQMMLLERVFLDPSGLPNYWERKHIILGKYILSKCHLLETAIIREPSYTFFIT